MCDYHIPPIYQESIWRNTTRVCSSSGNVGFGLILKGMPYSKRFQMPIGEARKLAETLLQAICEAEHDVPIPTNQSATLPLVVRPTDSDQLCTCKRHLRPLQDHCKCQELQS